MSHSGVDTAFFDWEGVAVMKRTYTVYILFHSFRKPIKLNLNSRHKNVKYEMINMMVVLFNSLEELIDFTTR